MRSSRRFVDLRSAAAVLLGAAGIALCAAAPALAVAGPSHHHPSSAGGGTFTSRVFATGNAITHPIPGGSETISQPDDITHLNNRIYVAFQNGVGPQGQASPSGNTASTIVAFSFSGRALRTWNVAGHCDGLTADPQKNKVIATVNEDANSSLYLISPHGGAAHYQYSEPLPHNGGTDAITIHHGMVLISASAPGTTGSLAAPQPTFPAVYRTTFDRHTHIANVSPLFYDEDAATVANNDAADYGQSTSLALTDPDSSENVPGYAARFAGDFMLTSQGDQEQIFVHDPGSAHQRLSVLRLTSSVDDTAWPSARNGTIYTTDNSDDSIYAITGPFKRGQVFVADTPCDENSAPATCPAAPDYPPNFLGQLNAWTGAITPVTLAGPAPEPQGMMFLTRRDGRRHDARR